MKFITLRQLVLHQFNCIPLIHLQLSSLYSVLVLEHSLTRAGVTTQTDQIVFINHPFNQGDAITSYNPRHFQLVLQLETSITLVLRQSTPSRYTPQEIKHWVLLMVLFLTRSILTAHTEQMLVS